MNANSLISIVFICLALYLAYQIITSSKLRRARSSAGTLFAKKHWPKGGRVEVRDKGPYSRNISRVAGKKFGNNANRYCVAYLVPDDIEPGGCKGVSVVIDGLKVGNLAERDVAPLFAILDHLQLGLATTSCDAYIGGGGVGIDGHIQPYEITLDISWFET